jgi:hypothetical protein
MKLFLLPLLLLVASLLPPNGEEKVMISRISYIMHLKATLGQQYWPGFNTVAGDVPLVYLTDSASYVANPTPRFLAMFRPTLIYHSRHLSIYKTPERINQTPFHMSTGMDLLDTAAFNYQAPFMFCSSPEATKKVIPDLRSTEEWASMLLHEYFHGFQFRHPPLLDYYLENIQPVTADSLNRIYRGNDWFKKLTDEENELLLQGINSPDSITARQHLLRFRNKRREKHALCAEKLHCDIRKYEGFYEKLEGAARYVEFQLLNNYRALPPNSDLQKTDTFYTANKQFKDFQLEKNKWLYETSRSANYVYATGFNMTRLLDKLKQPYKEQLFTQPARQLDDLLVPLP